MKFAGLVSFGGRLSTDLEAAAERYNVKSDLRDILCYESATVSAYLALLVRGEPVPKDRQKSVLLGDWGRSYEWDEPDLLYRTAEFYRFLREHGIAMD